MAALRTARTSIHTESRYVLRPDHRKEQEIHVRTRDTSAPLEEEARSSLPTL